MSIFSEERHLPRKNDQARIVVTGASPDKLNRNINLRHLVVTGFSDLLGHEQVANIPLEQAPETARVFEPNLILVFGSCLTDISDYAALRCAADQFGAHLAFWMHDDPYEFDYHFRAEEFADTIFTNDSWALEHYRAKRVFHLPLAACPHAHFYHVERRPPAKYDVFFAGVAYENRIRMMQALAPALRKYRTCIRGSGWPELPGGRNSQLSSSELHDHYILSRVVLNLGRDLSLANDRFSLAAATPGPRTFEAAMAGCIQLYHVTGLEIEKYFDPGKEILLFDDARDAMELIDDIIHNTKRFASIGQAAQERCLRDHTYSARARVIIETCISGHASQGSTGSLVSDSAALPLRAKGLTL